MPKQLTYAELADCSRADIESIIVTADDWSEYNEWLDELEQDIPELPDDDYDRAEAEFNEARRLAMIRVTNRETIEDLLALRGIRVSIPLCFGDDI